ncbi:hypothetical protein GOBAR_AA09951 [Gossypium barbadense]|uniref:Amidase domain-containing protein n=1 Tax=Gossypium barbadense TaxID=3634 RepID=A0A2P5Y503_GOSBA|nr:hypothetical protein GOBAR_AA09951 [Gossypium barbadense]
MIKSLDYGAFMEKFSLQLSPSQHQLPLRGLTFAVKDIFDIEGYVTGFGNPDWARTHSAATSTAPAVMDLLTAGATCLGKTVMDEMAYWEKNSNTSFAAYCNSRATGRSCPGHLSGNTGFVRALARRSHCAKVMQLRGRCPMSNDFLLFPFAYTACRGTPQEESEYERNARLIQSTTYTISSTMLSDACAMLQQCPAIVMHSTADVANLQVAEHAVNHSLMTSLAALSVRRRPWLLREHLENVVRRLNPGGVVLLKSMVKILAQRSDCMYGVNKHYGTPTNPCVPDRVPGGSSSGSAVAVAAKLVDFSLGTDTGASVRVPASYCGILGFRPSLGAVSTVGVLPMSQSYDTVGWFARDPMILNRVGRVLLHLPDVDPIKPSQIIIAEDCFRLSTIPSDRTAQVLVKSIEKLFGGHPELNVSFQASDIKIDFVPINMSSDSQCVKHVILGDHVKDKVPSLQHFMDKGNEDQEDDIPSLAALSSAMRLLQRYEFKNYHAKWVTKVNPDFGPGISERIWDAIKATGENIDFCQSVRTELRAALTALLGDHGILALPTTPGEPPKVQANPATSDIFFSRPFSLLSVAGSSGFCQVSIPLGRYDNVPLAISLVAKHGSDAFLLNLVETLYDTLQETI